MQNYETVKELVYTNNSQTFHLSADMVKLEVIQDALAQLMVRIDEITYKGWDKEPAMAYNSIGEIERTVRLMDMAFYPLFKEMKECVEKLSNQSEKLFDIVRQEENKKADAGTSTQE